MRRLFLAATLFCLIVSVASAQDNEPKSDVAPDFHVTDLNGKALNLAENKGKVVLLDFWATWCVPCQTEIPQFTEWQKKYGPDGFQVIALSMDDDEGAVREFLRRYKVNYPIAMATPEIAQSYGGVLGLPANFVIARDGRIATKHIGMTELSTIEDEIKAELSRK